MMYLWSHVKRIGRFLDGGGWEPSRNAKLYVVRDGRGKVVNWR